jgi:hypothetical protein
MLISARVGIGVTTIVTTYDLDVNGSGRISGGITTNTILAIGLIYANAGISIPTGQSLTLSGTASISAITMTASGLISANGGITTGTTSSLITANNGIIVNTATTGTNDVLNMRYDTRNGIRFTQRYVGVDDVRYDLIQKVANVDKTTSLTFYNGNVGIGTTNPSQIFQVGNGGRLMIANNTSGVSLIGTQDSDGATNTRIALGGNTFSSPGVINYFATSTGSHAFYTTDSTTERLRITSTGNVGIGTTNPQSSYKLQVQGNTWVENQLVFNNGYRQSGANYACNKIALWGGANTPTTTSTFGFGISDGTLDYFGGAHRFYTGTGGGTSYGSERMKVWSNGAVSIQTTGYAIPTNANCMRGGSLTIGNTSSDYGWGQNWNANVDGVAGLLLECNNYTEISVHDSGARIVSTMAYYNNLITIGRNMGYGSTNLNCEGAIAFGTSASPAFTCDVPSTGTGNSGYYYM